MPAVFSLTRSQRAATDLIWDFMAREERRKELRNLQTPILVFTGPRGSGKSVIFQEFAGLLPRDDRDRRTRGRRFPCARVDGEWPLESARDMLTLLAFDLADSAKGALLTPRLATGLIVLQADLDLSMTDHSAACDQVSSVLAERKQSKRNLEKALGAVVRASVEMAVQTAAAFGITVPASVGSIASDYFGEQVTSLLLGKLADTARGRELLLGKGQEWYGDQDRKLDRDPLGVLVRMKKADGRARASRGERDADAGKEVTELLWGAFLADLREAFADKKAATWTRNAVVLLDNADTQVARSFLEDLVAARRQREGETPREREQVEPDPLTVVVSSRGGLTAPVRVAGLASLAEASREHYQKQVSAGSSTWWYPVQLPAWDWAETRDCLGALELASIDAAADTTAVHAFTGGNPHAVSLMLGALGEQPQAAADSRLLTLLSAPEPQTLDANQRSVEEAILARQLLSLPADDPAFAEDLITCAAARHREAALRLATDSDFVKQRPHNDRKIFSPEFWAASPGGPAVLPPLLRRLLLRQLAARGETWARVHLWLRDRALAEENEGAALFHTLSLTWTPQRLLDELAGGVSPVEDVVRDLTGRLENSDARAWLSLVADVTAAPSLLTRPGDLSVQVNELTAWAGQRKLPVAAVARFVVYRWLGGDPLSAPRWKWLLDEMAAELELLAPSSNKGLTVLRAEAQRYRDIADGSWRDIEDFWMTRPGAPAETYGGTQR